MFRTVDDVRDDMVRAGIAHTDADLLAREAKPAVWLETRKVDDESQIAVGATKLGGRPDLPVDVAWPIRAAYPAPAEHTRFLRGQVADPDKAWSWAKPEDRERYRHDALQQILLIESEQPLSFVAQINLAEMWAAGPLDPDMPRQGVVSIFYDRIREPWGFDPRESVGFAILFHGVDGKPWARRDEPAPLRALAPNYLLSALACTTHACLTPLPLTTTAQYATLGLSSALTEQLWRDWYWSERGPCSKEGGADWRCHHVGGWPTPVQGDMQTECALVQAGHYCGNGDAYQDPTLAAVRATATDWLLLAQIGTDEEKGNMMWGDDGQIYVWIRRDDLRAGRFESARLILQCY